MKKLLLLAMLAVSSHSMAADYFNCGGVEHVIDGNTMRVKMSSSSFKRFTLDKEPGSTDEHFIATFSSKLGTYGEIARAGKRMEITFDGDDEVYSCRFITSDAQIKQRSAKAAADKIKREKEEEAARKAKEEKDRKFEAAMQQLMARNQALHEKVMSGKQPKLYAAGGADWKHGANGVAMSYVCDLVITDIVNDNQAKAIMYEKGGVIIKDYGVDNIEVSYKPLEGIHKTVRASMNGGSYTFTFRNGTMNFVDNVDARNHPTRAYKLYNCATVW